MKKMMLLGALLLCAAGVGYAQESRQDVSASAYGMFNPSVNGRGLQMDTTKALGFLGSYRYSVTPRSSLELNYSFLQNAFKYFPAATSVVYVHSREQEITGAYVYSRNYHNFNPFVEAGVGGMIFTPIKDFGTSQLDTRQNTNIGALFGGGVAYEISPSFDIRAEYRGFLAKAPDFGKPVYQTNRYMVFSMPAVGIAYHF
ncbi:MAG TPA: outer membrane beta-barrel protein [Acidobacteriaceae bacterium]|jgi:opacity protein-like surface antigen